MIFHEADPCHGFYIVGSGAVKLYKESYDAKEHALHVVMPGDCFGEAALFLGTGYPASAAAGHDSALILLLKIISSTLRDNPEVSFRLMAAMATWAHRLVTSIESLTLKDAAARFAASVFLACPIAKTMAPRLFGHAQANACIPSGNDGRDAFAAVGPFRSRWHSPPTRPANQGSLCARTQRYPHQLACQPEVVSNIEHLTTNRFLLRHCLRSETIHRASTIKAGTRTTRPPVKRLNNFHDPETITDQCASREETHSLPEL